MSGYPDWQAYPAWAGQTLVSANYSVTAAAPFTQNLTVTSWASVFLGLSQSAGGVTVELTWYTDATFTTSIGYGLFWIVVGTRYLNVNFPAVTGHVNVTIRTTAAGTATGKINLVPTNTQASPPLYPFALVAISGLSESVAAGTDNSHDYAWVAAQPMYASLVPDDTSAKLSLQVISLNQDGTTAAIVAKTGASAGPTSVTFPNNGQSLRAILINSDGAAAHSGSWYVGPVPRG